METAGCQTACPKRPNHGAMRCGRGHLAKGPSTRFRRVGLKRDFSTHKYECFRAFGNAFNIPLHFRGGLTAVNETSSHLHAVVMEAVLTAGCNRPPARLIRANARHDALQSWDENEAPERLLKAPGSPGTNFKGRSPQSPDCPGEAAAHQRSMAGRSGK